MATLDLIIAGVIALTRLVFPYVMPSIVDWVKAVWHPLTKKGTKRKKSRPDNSSSGSDPPST